MPNKAQLQQQLDEKTKEVQQISEVKTNFQRRLDSAEYDLRKAKQEIDAANATIRTNQQSREVLRSLIESHLMSEHGVEVSPRDHGYYEQPGLKPEVTSPSVRFLRHLHSTIG